ncbi:hypothetical protein K437DRAFT_274375 [Tilletiaria anomala UBC 951]|uniref:BHLH domain-containing protein n=1 Tax=Tilletiaria anomala (strain ATCC 24038 / CBS 436.72 / UBC 951) TaxID=1037660 RepID=A0A066VXC5_TILAU|nr:uncharacterized protein K437DRAFT_274375 [Tilletiaria anomala UBC 951]KDN44928.1 hypothetical protein K437DRAFT_274375 [Tilletiaria anomala UBC 951]
MEASRADLVSPGTDPSSSPREPDLPSMTAASASSAALTPQQPTATAPPVTWNGPSPTAFSEFIHSPRSFIHPSLSSPRTDAASRSSRQNSPALGSNVAYRQQGTKGRALLRHQHSSMGHTRSELDVSPNAQQHSGGMDQDAGVGNTDQSMQHDVAMRSSDSQEGYRNGGPANDDSSSMEGDEGANSILFSPAEANFMAESLSSADRMDPFGQNGFVVPARLPPRLGFGSGTLDCQGMPKEQQQRPYSHQSQMQVPPHSSSHQQYSPPHHHSLQQIETKFGEASTSKHQLTGRDASTSYPGNRFSPAQGQRSLESLRAQWAATALLGGRSSWDVQMQSRAAVYQPSWPAGLPGSSSAASMSGDRTQQNGMAFVDHFGPSSSLRDVAETLRKQKGGIGAPPGSTMIAEGPEASGLAKSGNSDAGGLVPDGFNDMPFQANPLGPPAGMTNLYNPNVVPLSAAALEAHQQVFGPLKVRRPQSGRGTTSSKTLATGYGNNPQWQMQQLHFLQEQRERALLRKERAEQEARDQARMASLQGNVPSLSQISQAFPSNHQFPGGQSGSKHEVLPTVPRLVSPGQHYDAQRGAGRNGQTGSKSKSPPAGQGSAIVFNASGWKPTIFNIEIDASRAKDKMPAHLMDLLLTDAEHKRQPHLQRLREQIASGEIEDPQIKVREMEAERECERKRKEPHQLLTDAEKKANHIASEQKRRANIKKGYEGLNELVPALRDALDKGGGMESGNAGGDDGSDEYDSDEADVSCKKKPTKKQGADEKAEPGRTGPRSEAIVLHRTLDYIRDQLEAHARLLARRKHARASLAAHYGVDIRVPAKPSSD